MARPRKKYPIAKKRKCGSKWQIYWTAPGKRYDLPTPAKSEVEAEEMRREVQAGLIEPTDFPSWALNHHQTQRYLN